MIKSVYGQGGQDGGSSRLSSPALQPGDNFWFALSDEQRARLREVARPCVYSARSSLMYQGEESDHVIVIESGWVKATTTTVGGHEVLLAVRGPGDLIGESALLGSGRPSVTTKALTPVHGIVLHAGRFENFLNEHPAVWKLIGSTLVQRQEGAERRLQAHISTKGARRLAGLLVELAEMSAKHVPPSPDGHITIAPPFSQEELGSWMDASRETVARALNNLRAQGLVRTGWRKIVVVDLPGLRRYAEGD